MPSCSAWATAAQISQPEEFRHASSGRVFSALEGKARRRGRASMMGLEMDISQKGVTAGGPGGVMSGAASSRHSIRGMGWDYLNSNRKWKLQMSK